MDCPLVQKISTAAFVGFLRWWHHVILTHFWWHWI